MATIQDVRSLQNPQRAYEYEVSILGSAASGNLPLLTQRVESVSIPATSVETIEVNFKGRKTFYAGRDASPHTITVNFYDGEDQAVYKFFRNWLNTMNNEVDGSGVTRDLYAAQMEIKTFAHDSATVTNKNTLTYLFPTEVGEVSLDYSSSEHFKFSVTFSYDTSVIG